MAAPLTMANVKPIRIVGGRSGTFAGAAGKQAGGFVSLQLDQKSLAKGRAMLDRYRDKPLRVRMAKAALAAAKVLEGPMKAATPDGPDNDPQLRKRTSARPRRVRKTFVEGKGWRTQSSEEAIVGPRSGHAHLVIRGHRIVTRGGRYTGRYSRRNPYPDSVARRHQARAIAEMRKHIFATGMQADAGRQLLYGKAAG